MEGLYTKEKYRQELIEKTEILERLKRDAKHGTVTFLYSAKDIEHNNAVALKEFLG